MRYGDPRPNPFYITGTKRLIYELILNILPTGQSLLIANMEANRLVLQILSSLAIAGLSTILGMAFFRKKDIK